MKCAIILAAGKSDRMGAQKVLLPLRGTTVLGHIVDRIARSAVERIFVVVGHEGERVAEALRGAPASIVKNPDHEAGMLSSVRCGLRALPEECEAVLVALGDQPRITTEVVDAMARAFSSGGKGIVVPVYRGERGHPILFAARYRNEILERHDDVGLRGLLAAHPDDILDLEVADAAVLSDMDDPDAYRREQRALG